MYVPDVLTSPHHAPESFPANWAAMRTFEIVWLLLALCSLSSLLTLPFLQLHALYQASPPWLCFGVLGMRDIRARSGRFPLIGLVQDPCATATWAAEIRATTRTQASWLIFSHATDAPSSALDHGRT